MNCAIDLQIVALGPNYFTILRAWALIPQKSATCLRDPALNPPLVLRSRYDFHSWSIFRLVISECTVEHQTLGAVLLEDEIRFEFGLILCFDTLPPLIRER